MPFFKRHRLLGVAALSLALAWLLIAMVSTEPVQSFRLLVTGALPEIRWSADAGFSIRRLARFGAMIEETTTLTLLALAVLFGFRARQFSIGADGQFFLGALAAALVSVWTARWPGWGLAAAAVAALAAGAAWGGIAGVLKARFGVNEIVATIMLNVIAIQFYRLVISLWFHDAAANMLVTPAVPVGATLPPLIGQTGVSAFVLLVPLAAVAAWWLLYRTTLGLEIRIVGDAPAFAEQIGVPVKRAIALSMALGGAFAGLAGLQVANGLLKRLPVDLSPGIGLEGLVVALLARNDPKAVPLAALLYAALKAGAQAMEQASDVPRELVLVLQACTLLLVVTERLLPAGAIAVVAGLGQRFRLSVVKRRGGSGLARIHSEERLMYSSDEGSSGRAEHRAAPRSARIPSGDRPMYSSDEGSS